MLSVGATFVGLRLQGSSAAAVHVLIRTMLRSPWIANNNAQMKAIETD
jgi:hypothetical protein